ncbi:MAG TPA: cobalamin biosynthesis protein CbiM [Clostridiaceae bacterium]|nr:cobalamin biosynthesis protein CbiM [Clostridiaceae bacterium]
MHIPDNYLSPSTCAVMGAVMVPIWTRAVKKVKREVTKKKLPLMGVGAAFSFLVMMFNVPLPGGTTGHAVGATLVALLIGPEAACISVTIALLIQALLFGDGGILAFGANCFNMAFIIPFSGYYIYKFIKGKINTERGEYIAIFIGSYIAINIAALFAAIEFGIQPLLFKDAAGMPLYCPYPLSVSIPAMLIPHLAVAGVLEGVITDGVYGFISKVSPGTVHEGSKTNMKPIYTLIAVMVCLSPLGLLAAGTAWGEWGAEEIGSVVSSGKSLGFIPKGMKNGLSFNALMPDYSVNRVPEIAGYVLSAIAGVAIILITFKLISNRKHNNESI